MKKLLQHQCCRQALSIMKILSLQTFMAILLASIAYAHDLSGQGIMDKEISVQFEQTSLKKILSKIEREAGVKFTYSPSVIAENEKISIRASNQKLAVLLDALFSPLDISYKLIADRISLYKAIDTGSYIESNESQTANAENLILTVAGTVVDENSQPIPGVNVIEKGTTNGTTTDANGKFSLNVQGENSVLAFSFIGYTTQEVAVNGRTMIDVTLAEDVHSLDEVVVTGYSSERKKDIIGSVAVVNIEEMSSTRSGNVINQLQGRVSGLTVSSDGSVNNAAKIRIRGFGSFNGSNPLYIIDGVPGDASNLNPDDIESIQVLKDGASAAVYGARAASGVIIITTTQGKKGAVKFSINSYSGMNFVDKSHFPDMLDAQEWANAYWKSMEGAGRVLGSENWTHPQFGNGATPVIPEYLLVNDHGYLLGGTILEQYRISDPAKFAATVDPARYDFETYQIVKSANTDWFNETYKPAPVRNISLSASGGSDNGTYAIGLNYFDQKNTADTYSYYKRYTLRVNTSLNVKKFLKIGENLQVSYNETRPTGNNPGSAWAIPSVLPVYDIMGNPAGAAAPGIISVGTEIANPIGQAWRNRFDKQWTYGVFGNVYADIMPVKDLVIRSSFGIDYTNYTSKDMTQVTYEHSLNTAPPNYLAWAMNNGLSWTFTNTMNYSKTLGLHEMKILLGTELVHYYSMNISATRQNLLIDNDDDYLVINSGSGAQTNGGSFSRNMLSSLFGRFDYAFSGKYLFNATLRRDGSSKFGISNRYGYFPSAAIGWRVTEEGFMQPLNWLSDLKVRASYGIIGNQTSLSDLNQYTTLLQSPRYTYPLSGTNNSVSNSYYNNRLGNPNARWEKATSTNLGFDGLLFNGATSITFDYFIRETKDLLVLAQAPYTGMNITQPSVNVGNISNEGIDLSLGQRGLIAGKINFEVTGNFSTYKNEVLKVVDNPAATLAGGSTRLGNANLTKQGYPISFFYGYQLDGFYNTQEEVDGYLATYSNNIIPPEIGRWRIKDVSGPDGVPDNVVNDFDRTMIGSPHPDFQVGLNLSLAYKGFDFTGFLFWSQGGDLFNYDRYYSDFQTFATNRSARFLYDSWTPTHTNALLPKLDVNDTFSNKYITSYFIEDATYLRLKTLQLGYTIPSDVVEKISVNKVRFYVQTQNVFTLTKFSGLDPGISISGDDLGMGVVLNQLPVPKQILFGINIEF